MTKRSDAGRLAVDGQELPGPDGVQAALDAAAEAGERAAVWLDGLAGRQPEQAHRLILLRTAAVVRQVTSREIIPGG